MEPVPLKDRQLMFVMLRLIRARVRETGVAVPLPVLREFCHQHKYNQNDLDVNLARMNLWEWLQVVTSTDGDTEQRWYTVTIEGLTALELAEAVPFGGV